MVPANTQRIPEYDPRSGEHLWVWTSMHRATIGDSHPVLNGDSVLAIVGPGCHHCGRLHTARLAQRRCTGKICRTTAAPE